MAISSFNDTLHQIKNNLSSLRFSLQLMEYDLEPQKKQEIAKKLTKILDKSLFTLQQLSLNEKFRHQKIVPQQLVDLKRLLTKVAPPSRCICRSKAYIVTNKYWLQKVLHCLLQEYPYITLFWNDLHPIIAFAQERIDEKGLLLLLRDAKVLHDTPPIITLFRSLGGKAFKKENTLFLQLPLLSRQCKIYLIVALFLAAALAAYV